MNRKIKRKQCDLPCRTEIVDLHEHRSGFDLFLREHYFLLSLLIKEKQIPSHS